MSKLLNLNKIIYRVVDNEEPSYDEQAGKNRGEKIFYSESHSVKPAIISIKAPVKSVFFKSSKRLTQEK